MTAPIPAMVQLVREHPDLPAELRVTPMAGGQHRFSLTLSAKMALLEELAASVGEDVRRAVKAAG